MTTWKAACVSLHEYIQSCTIYVQNSHHDCNAGTRHGENHIWKTMSGTTHL